jgi:hypothetical protein
MNSSEKIFKYIKDVESTNSSFCKIGDSADTLILSFGHIAHGGFAGKQSLINKKCENNNFDILYMRDVKKKWYLCELSEIGNSFSDTLNFLKSVTSKYKNTIYIGSSMGGYASILFASLLKGITVIAQMPQTDLEYIINNNSCIDIFEPIKNKHSDIWNSYKNLNPIINDSTHYIMGGFDPTASVLHDMHHKNNIKSHENVTLPNDFDFVKEVNKHI